MISTMIIFFGVKTFLIFSIGIIFFFVFLNFLPTINIIQFIPETFLRIKRFTFFINTPRLVIFRSAMNFIFQRPLLGWGSGTFALIYLAKENFWNPPFRFYEFQHTHNLFLEMAFNFGIPCIVSENLGTSKDLIKDGINGFILKDANKYKICNYVNSRNILHI